MTARSRAWLDERYGEADLILQAGRGERPLILDAGCGAGHSILAWAGERLRAVDYVGIDASDAIRVARTRFGERGLAGLFVQGSLMRVPVPEECFDLILAEGVLHHTDDTRAALLALTSRLRRGGRMLFYVYRRKGPIREFTDDYLRARLHEMSPTQGWEALMPLTRLGKALGDADVTVDVPEAIDLLGIPAGPISVQRLFYWHVFKAFYAPEMTVDEMNHVNFDWYAPVNARRHTIEEVREWCAEAGLEIDREVVEPAGITIVSTRM
ncbi:class I SAM-dependent methyltransferase [Magnetospirillum sp. SS-4]|uniref:class I SAM-dependent methyltransferase n=1 Tax=Magnetospirillum sp. SS-4 TaxID=2681465 RepID=UPI001C2D5459|nr:class I SAM-dependent methyltransferase [Magnetospirillum sp. SS-4]